jgi:hypothetical protein
MQVYLTGYSYWDNDPPGSAEISDPVIHRTAGGTGTYTDPITMAVGYTSAGPDIAPGTRFYIAGLKRYFIVEDTCAACHSGHNGLTWVDVYVDGAQGSTAASEAAMSALTGVTQVIKDPAPGLAVTPQPLS